MQKYVREVTITFLELVPAKEMLPQCEAWQADLSQCWRKAKYEMNGNPVCGLHLGKPSLVFIPDRMKKKGTA